MDSQFEDKHVRCPNSGLPHDVLRYRLLKPATREAGTEYPLVLYLHGAGERGDDNLQQLNYLPSQMAQENWRRDYPCFLIAPQCPTGMRWVEVAWNESESRGQAELSVTMEAVLQILEAELKAHPIDRTRIYLTGISMGGFGAWDLALRKPELFAAGVPICGGGDEQLAPRLAKTPVWAWHGDADDAVPVERSRRMIAAIRAAGGEPRYSELPGMGHHSWIPAYEDPQGAIPWMFSQRREEN